MAAAEPQTEREALQAEIAAARARAEAYRKELKADLERRKTQRLLDPQLSEDLEQARRASDQVRNDWSLQKGDIVSTVDGLFVFIGTSEGDHGPADFVRLPSPSHP
jgi:multidrug resistance efflux pump